MTGTEPYGPLVETTARVLTWNVWGEFGPREVRAERIAKAVREADPDVAALQEWAGQTLGYEHVAALPGRPVRCEIVGDGPEPGSDYYGVLAGLRY